MSEIVLPTLPPILETEVDGIRTFWVDEPGPTVACLMFRVGRTDEPTPVGGISHIVEHLALAGLGVQDYDHNGFVDADTTVFTNIGTADEITSFLGTVTAGLREPPLGRLAMERRILREERAQRGPNVAGAIRWYRYGYTGPGRGVGPDDDELGLDWLGPEPVQAWVRRWFVRQNAVLWLTGPVPADLRLDLPDGEPAPAPRLVPVPGITFPAHARWEGPGANLGLTAPRSSAFNAAAAIAHRRARQRLRFDQGLVYDVSEDYEPIDPGTAHVFLGADCTPERVPAVTDGLVGILRELAGEGPTQAEIDQETRAFSRQFDDRDGRIGRLAIHARDALWGGDLVPTEELLEGRRRLRPDEVAVGLGDALHTLLVLADTEAVEGLHPYPMWSDARVDGRTVEPAGFFLPGRRPKDRLVVGREGLTYVGPGGELMTVRFASSVACIHPDDDTRVVLDRDGIRVGVRAGDWKTGPDIVRAIDAAIPPELVACDQHGVGAMPDPSDPPDAPGAAAAQEPGTSGTSGSTTRRSMLTFSRTWTVTVDGAAHEVIVAYAALFGWMSIHVDGERVARGWREWQSVWGGAELSGELAGHRLQARVAQPFGRQEYAFALSLDGVLQPGSDALPAPRTIKRDTLIRLGGLAAVIAVMTVLLQSIR